MERSPNNPGFGCTHVWEAWFGSDYTRYRAYAPRFASEFGHQAAPTFATLAAALPDDQRAVDAPGLQHHQRSPTGQERLQDLLDKHFSEPDTFDDWIFATQLNQVRALRTGIDWFRSRHPVCQGMLYWQLNDCWPVLSWSAIDGPGRPKLLWYATRRFFRGRRLSIQPSAEATSSDPAADTDRPVGAEPGSLRLFGYNDTDAPWTAHSLVRRVGLDGRVHARDTLTLSVPPRSVRSVPLADSFAPRSPHAECVLADRSTGDGSDGGSAHRGSDPERIGERASWFFVRDKHLAYPSPHVDVSVDRPRERATPHAATQAPAQARVTLTARTLIRDACLLLDRLDPEATVSDQLFTLLPGESVTLAVHSPDRAAADRLAPGALSAPPVFQCANRFGASSQF
jgi:beta-mannosidase